MKKFKIKILALLLVLTLTLELIGYGIVYADKPTGSFYYIEELGIIVPKVLRLKSIHYLSSKSIPLGKLITSNRERITFKQGVTSIFDLTLTYPVYRVRVLGEGSARSFSNMLDYIGVSRVKSLGFEGENVTIAIVDTGVDFTIPTLGLNAIARDEEGRPLTLDSDQLGFALTPLEARVVSNVSKVLDVKGKTVDVYIPLGIIAEFEIEYPWVAPPIPSKSGVYKFGFLVEFSLFQNLIFDFSAPAIGYLIPVILVDSTTPRVYDTVYLDLSSIWFIIGSYLYAFGALASPPPLRMLDFSFLNEKPLRYGNELAYIDSNNDGIADFSAGIISGYVYDAFGLIGAINESKIPLWEYAWEYVGSGIYPGLDVEGKYVCFFYDPIGHGTSVASIIAGRSTTYNYPSAGLTFNIFPFEGIAPKAKIAGATAVYAGDVIVAQLWFSGHEYHGNWTWSCTGKRRVDIINNSWGLTLWYLISAFGVKTFIPGLDPISEYEDYIVERTGTIIVHAAGNEGPGYGTITGGGSSRLAITVGATTFLSENIYFWDQDLLLPKAVSDQVISWSSRGPTVLSPVKPDLVAPGAYAVVPTFTMGGLGDGSRSLDVFGGTSMSAPIVSGATALLLEASRHYGIDVKPWLLKSIIKSSATPLGYDPYVEGSGRINVSRAYDMIANDLKGLLLTINNLPYNPLPLRDENYIKCKDSSLYLEVLDDDVSFNVEAYGFKGYPNIRIYTYVKAYGKLIEDVKVVHGNYTPLIIPDEVLDYDVVSVIVRYNITDLIPDSRLGDYKPKKYLVGFLGLWDDINNNSKIEFKKEFTFLTHTPGISNVLVLEVIPPANLDSKVALALKSIPKENFTVDVEIIGYKVHTVNWFEVLSVKVEDWGCNITFKLSDNLPSNPGFYEGYIEFSNDNISSRLPFTLVIPVMLRDDYLLLNPGATGFKFENWVVTSPSIYGSLFSGDWRYYIVRNYEGENLAVRISWGDRNSSVEAIGLSGVGRGLVGEMITGRLSPTLLVNTLEYLIPTYYTDYDSTVMIIPSTSGTYIVAVHNTLSHGSNDNIVVELSPLKVRYKSWRGWFTIVLIKSRIPLGMLKVEVDTWSYVVEHKGGISPLIAPRTAQSMSITFLEHPPILLRAKVWGMIYNIRSENLKINIKLSNAT